MSSPERPEWPPGRTLFWAVAALFATFVFGPQFVKNFRPPDNAEEATLVDFIQEWLSAKNYEAGLPVYTNQAETLFRHTGMRPGRDEPMLRWNAHPPASVLLGLPFARLNYPDAQFAWNLVSFLLFVVSLALVLRELGVRYPPQAVLPTVTLILLCGPIATQISQGQLNFVLTFLLVLGWAADRRGYTGWAGAAVGAAAAFKLYPAFVFLYFVCTRRWRALATGAVAFLALNGLALALFGTEAFRTYFEQVVPSVVQYQTGWRNLSLNGFWIRVFTPLERSVPLIDSPAAGRAVGLAVRGLVVLVAAAVCWRAKTVEQRDRAFAVTLVGMLLVSPITWNHYLVLLLMPVALVWARLPGGPVRVLMVVVFVFLWLPPQPALSLVLGKEQAQALLREIHRPLTPAQNLTAISLPHYALVGLFLLTLLVRTDPEPAAGAKADALDRRRFGPPADEPRDAPGGRP